MSASAGKFGTRVHEVLHRLEDEILYGQLTPGARLDEQKLAARFGVSRTPVREAIRHLEAAGLLEVRPRKGAVVAEIPIPRMIQMFEVMTELEGLCARLAARRMNAEERKRLQTAHRECERLTKSGACDPDRYFALSSKFHETIYAGARNAFLRELARNIRTRVSTYRRRQLFQPGRIAQWHEEQEVILHAVLAGDADLADEVMRRHVSVQGDIFVDFLTEVTTAEVMAGGWR